MLLGMYRRYWRYASVQRTHVRGHCSDGLVGGHGGLHLACDAAGAMPSGSPGWCFFSDWLLTLALAGGLRLAIRVVNESASHRGGEPGRASRRIPDRRRWGRRHDGGPGDAPQSPAGDGAGRFSRRRCGRRSANSMAGLSQCLVTPEARAHRSVEPHRQRGHRDAHGLRVPRVQRSSTCAMKLASSPRQFRACSSSSMDRSASIGLRNVDIADLLRRSPSMVVRDAAAFARGTCRASITGGGGSIGSELARQIANAGPSHLVLLGHGENSIFEAEARLRAGVSPGSAQYSDRRYP